MPDSERPARELWPLLGPQTLGLGAAHALPSLFQVTALEHHTSFLVGGGEGGGPRAGSRVEVQSDQNSQLLHSPGSTLSKVSLFPVGACAAKVPPPWFLHSA